MYQTKEFTEVELAAKLRKYSDEIEQSLDNDVSLKIGLLREVAKRLMQMDWLRRECRVMFDPPDDSCPIEHTTKVPGAKDRWETLMRWANPASGLNIAVPLNEKTSD